MTFGGGCKVTGYTTALLSHPVGDSDHNRSHNFNMPPAIPELKNMDKAEIHLFLSFCPNTGVKTDKVNPGAYIPVK